MVSIRLTQGELEMVESNAQAMGQTVSECLRNSAMQSIMMTQVDGQTLFEGYARDLRRRAVGNDPKWPITELLKWSFARKIIEFKGGPRKSRLQIWSVGSTELVVRVNRGGSAQAWRLLGQADAENITGQLEARHVPRRRCGTAQHAVVAGWAFSALPVRANRSPPAESPPAHAVRRLAWR
jgi:hypothetical protein